jgi:hypothetical protein
MAGRTGKRAKAPGRCVKCAQPIRDAEFLRDRKGDMHILCPIRSGELKNRANREREQ